ncbi:hypothetical protein [Streptomyces sp. NPDC048410]|uniref:hypothetical protein n=1 Tax=Streptomyces sp. NPDC048410 TaxID=3365545 RepID=UPI00371FB2D7
MDLAHPLDGLDDHPWPASSHAYGSAEDVPGLLRALSGPDQDAADEALSELYSSVLHQGTVYAASADAAPFLARIAAAGHRTADVMVLLGGLAESEDEYGVPTGTVRAAVAEQLPLLLPSLTAAEPDVRRAAAWAVSHTRAAGIALPALRTRWAEESVPAVRAEVLSALARLDPQAGSAVAATALEPSQPAEVRLAALFAGLDAGAPWTRAMHTEMLSLLPADALRSDLDHERGEPLSAVVKALLIRGDGPEREAAFALVEAALRSDRADVRTEGLWAADCACMLSRSAPARLIRSLCEAAVDEASVISMASLLGQLGSVAAPAADILVPLARRNPNQVDDHADRALAALALVAPVKAVPFLAAGLGRRPWALDAAAGTRAPADFALPYDDGLLDAVRDRLSRPESLSGNEPWQLITLLRGWGADAAPALPELCAALPRFPFAAGTIATIAADCAPEERGQAATSLRTAADQGSLPAAQTLYDLIGEPAPLLRCLEEALRGGARELRDAALATGALGPQGAPLVPALRAALSGPSDDTTPALDADTALAEALWRVTGEADEVIAVLDSVFTRAGHNAWSRWSVVRAARAAALLGPAGRPLVPRLTAALDHPTQAPAAVLALLAVADPASLDRAALIETTLRSAEWDTGALRACDALEALGTTGMTDDQLRRLATLAHGDTRVIRSGVQTAIIYEDEAFQSRLQALTPAPEH